MVYVLKWLSYVYTLASLRTYAYAFPIFSSLTLEGVFLGSYLTVLELEQASWHCYHLGNPMGLPRPISELKVLRDRKEFPSNQ
jgi:hypothetical protein